MKPVSFPEANLTLMPPDAEGCCDSQPIVPLHVFNDDGRQCISCWELDDADRAAIAHGAKVWLHVLSSPSAQPPVGLHISENPFV
jgi:hypothetical protein